MYVLPYFKCMADGDSSDARGRVPSVSIIVCRHTRVTSTDQNLIWIWWIEKEQGQPLQARQSCNMATVPPRRSALQTLPIVSARVSGVVRLFADRQTHPEI
jgi:hypothetical protein